MKPLLLITVFLVKLTITNIEIRFKDNKEWNRIAVTVTVTGKTQKVSFDFKKYILQFDEQSLQSHANQPKHHSTNPDTIFAEGWMYFASIF